VRRAAAFIFMTSVFLLAADTLRSLPAFNAMFRAKKGFTPSCAVCHTAGDNRLTPYGREFRRLGRGAPAFDTLDVMDPDGDGVPSKAEIKARANPGDRRSTPTHAGDWLSQPAAPEAPKKLFADVFGAEAEWTAVDATLSAAAASRGERLLGEKLRDESLYPTVFLVRRAGAPAGVVGYAFFGDAALTVYYVAAGNDGAALAVRPLTIHVDQRLARPEYLRQFVGKTAAAPPAATAPRGAEAESADVARAVRRALKIMDLAVTKQ